MGPLTVWRRETHTVFARRDATWLLPVVEDFIARVLDLFLGRRLDHVLPQSLLLLNVLLNALELVLEGVEQLRVAVVEELAVLVLLLSNLYFALFIGHASAFSSHVRVESSVLN